MKKWLFTTFMVATLAFLPLFAHALEVPQPKGYVTDYAGMLKAEEIAALEQKLQNFEKETSIEIAVLIIPSLEGENLEKFSLKVAEKWGVGKKGKDNGVLIFVAKKERKIRIEVGYGLEPVMPDGAAGFIIREDMKPKFKDDKYFKGLDKAVDSLMKATSKEFSGEFQKRMDRSAAAGLALLLCFVGAIITIIASFINRFFGGVVCGTGAALTFGLLFHLALFWVVLIFIAGFLLGLIAREIGEAIDEGGSGDGYGFGGSSSGGGFGGGGFGGGGASGGW